MKWNGDPNKSWHADMEVRSDEGRTIHGYIVEFGKLSVNMGGFREKVMPGAFTKTLKEKREILMLKNHDSSEIVATTANGTLRLWEDERGLAFEVTNPVETSYVEDLLVAIRGNFVRNCSFGFRGIRDQWTYELNDEQGNKYDLRELLEVELYEVSIGVGMPAYPDSSTFIRSALREYGVAAPLVDIVLRRLVDDAEKASAGAPQDQEEPGGGSHSDVANNPKPEARAADGKPDDGFVHLTAQAASLASCRRRAQLSRLRGRS